MHDVRWGAFIPALILASLVLAIPAFGALALGAWLNAGINPLGIVAMATVVAAGAGAPTYLTLGAAAFWYALRRTGPDASFWSMALAANLIATPFVLAFFLISDPRDALGSTVFLIGFGCIFAPLWGGIFGWIYRTFTRIGAKLRDRAASLRQDANAE